MKVKQGNRRSARSSPIRDQGQGARCDRHPRDFGLTDWVRGVADQLAEAGFIAIAPDLLSGAAPGGGGTAEPRAGMPSKVIGSRPDQITADLNAMADYVSKLPACTGAVLRGRILGAPRLSVTPRTTQNSKGVRLLRKLDRTFPPN